MQCCENKVTSFGKRIIVDRVLIKGADYAEDQIVGADIVRARGGRIVRATAPDGRTLVYSYDSAGRLAGVRQLQDGSGARYGYDAENRLTIAAEIGGAGQAISYGADGAATVTPVVADLSGLGQFTGRSITGTGPATYTRTIRDSEVRAAAGGRLILRVATDATGAVPVITGAQLLSRHSGPDGNVALYSFTTLKTVTIKHG